MLGGVAGATCRMALGHWVSQSWPSAFPLSTIAVNIIGCFALGMMSELISPHASVVRVLLLTGFLGGFTTFSAFSFDAMLLLQQGRFLLGSAYIASSILLCLGGVFVGHFLARAFVYIR